MIVVTGIGWVSAFGYGRVKSQVRKAFGPGALALPPRAEVFDSPFRNFGRLDHASQVVCCSVGLAVKDSGISLPFSPNSLVGIVGGGRTGCAEADLLYYRDYVEGGRTLGRGNYFVYTLPTSPLAEASIHFGLRAATLYVQDAGEGMGQVLETGAKLIEDQEATAMLAGISEGGTACFAMLEQASPDMAERVLCPLGVARNVAGGVFNAAAAPPVPEGPTERRGKTESIDRITL